MPKYLFYKIIRVLLILTLLFNSVFPASVLNIPSRNSDFKTDSVRANLDETQNEYLIDIGPIDGASGTNYVYVSFFNPSSSGSTVLVRKITVKTNPTATASGFPRMNIRRTTAASGGTSISSTDIPKKNSLSSNSVTEIRHTIGTSGVTLVGSDDAKLLGFTSPANVNHLYGIRTQDFTDSAEPLVLKEGEGIALIQLNNTSANTKVRMMIEWEEVSSTPSAQNTYVLAYPRIENAASAGYAYGTFFNPVSSGKVAIVNKIWFGPELCDAAATWNNDISIKRISDASDGTQITTSDIPKKNTSSTDSTVQVRHTGVTKTEVGGSDARLAMITPCGASTAVNGFMEMIINHNDEKLIFKEGEGFAVISEATGDVDQLMRIYVEWQEIDSGSLPSSQGEYMFAYPRISGVAFAADTTFYTLFNPSGSGKTAVVKKLGIRNDADAAASAIEFTFKRITTASGGVSISNSDIPKKHSDSSTSVMELRYCGSTCGTSISATYVGNANSSIISVNGPSGASQLIGHLEYTFKNNEKIVLQEGEGIAFKSEASGDIDHYVKTYLEWEEDVSTPNSQGEYIMQMGSINGVTTSGYTYLSLYNPSGSGKVTVIKHMSLRIDNAGAAAYDLMSLRRVSAVSGGNVINGSNIPKKHSSTSDSAMDVRRAGITPTWSDGSDSRISSIVTNDAVTTSSTIASGHTQYSFDSDDPFILREGEGIALYQEGGGDTSVRMKWLVEWDEENSAPTITGDYFLTTPPVSGNTTSGYVFSSIFNPSDSGKLYVVKRLEARVNRTNGNATAPTYEPFVIRRITDSSSGTLMNTSDIPKKDTQIGTSTAQVRTANPTVTYSGSSDSKLLSFLAPGVENAKGDFLANISQDDDLVLAPGEGIALYQDSGPGDTFRNITLTIQWYEANEDQPVVSIALTDGVISFGYVPLGVDRSTIDLVDTQTVLNDGEGVIDVQIKGENTSCPWTLSSSAGPDQYVHSFSINSGDTWTPLTTSYQNLITGLDVEIEDTFDLKITPPTSTNCYSEQEVEVTVQAVAQ